jgi:sortase A
MQLGRKEQRVVRYILNPAALLVIGLGVYFIGGRPVINMISSEMEYAVAKGEPVTLKAVDQDNMFSDETTGVIDGDQVAPIAGKQYGEISCDKVSLSVPLYYGDTYDILEKGAGQSALSYCPGQGGTILVGGHDTTYFAPLENMEKGMDVVVKTNYGTFTYKVNDIQTITGSDYSISSLKEQLVLYTCYPFGDILNERTQKIAYICDKTEGPEVTMDEPSDNGGGEDEQ